MGEYTEISYNVVLGRDILTELVINNKLSKNNIYNGKGPYE